MGIVCNIEIEFKLFMFVTRTLTVNNLSLNKIANTETLK